ncbi:MAG: hypothetical protein IAE80_29500 [Anaerolinea sp.]|nr:hypothetical protein [Anaerolinea sp.]
MSNLLPNPTSRNDTWKTQAYVIGAAAGLLFGLVSAYMYTRAAHDNGQPTEGMNRVQTGDVLGLGLAALAMVRQIAEMGRGPEPKRGRRK